MVGAVLSDLTMFRAQLIAARDKDPRYGVLNLRDVSAGAGCAEGFLFRAGALHRSSADGNDLESLHIGTVIDLREPSEATAAPDVPINGTRLLSRPIYGGDIPTTVPLQQVYRHLFTKCAPALASAVNTIVTHLHDGVLVHCTAGKDRTGVVIACFLAAVGADRRSIITDYSLSGGTFSTTYRQQTIQLLRRTVADPSVLEIALHLHLESPPEAIEAVLDWLDTECGGARTYLLAHGVSASKLDAAASLLFPLKPKP